MEVSTFVNLLTVLLVATALLVLLTLLAAAAGAPRQAAAQCALFVGILAAGLALKEPVLWSVLAAPVVDVVANLVP